MSLKHKISEQMTGALKAGDKARLGALRFLLAAVYDREKKKREDLTDEEVQQVVVRLIKQGRDSIALYTKGSREELADKERSEIEVFEEFVPPELSADEIRAIVAEAAAEVEARDMKDMGRLMKAVMGRAAGRVDGSVVQQVVRDFLKAQE